jgi:two-component system, chemotaxis family, chemotaxis protein CheY
MPKETTLKGIAEWLVGIEEIAGQVYRSAADVLQENHGLAEFLNRLAYEESQHYHAMISALNFMERNEIPLPSEVILDDQTRANVEDPFRRMEKLLEDGQLTEQCLLENFMDTEFSEWNTLFLYVVNTLKDIKIEFQYSAAEMQHHLREIEEYIVTLPRGEEYLRKKSSLPKVWEPRVLIVDDSPVFRALLSSLLKGFGTIETANDGREALEKSSKLYYDAIVSDVQMPVMDGPSFYTRLAEQDPLVHSRFLFFTATPTTILEAFFRDEELRFMTKPAPINKLKDAVRAILRRRR